MRSAIHEAPTSVSNPPLERILGRYETGRPGPVVIVTAGLHGNEPGGTIAARRVLARLEATAAPLRGQIVCLAGNLSALERGVRYVERDLNRGWTEEKAAELLACDRRELRAEDLEQRELLEIFDRHFERTTRPLVFLDLHSTSAGGSPFCAIADTLRNRRIAFHLPVPVILGLEETVAGTMLSYLDGLGHISAVFEGGQHEDPATVDHHESAIWLTLEAAGCLGPDEIHDRDHMKKRLSRAAAGQPAVVEMFYREPVCPPEDGFRMKPGYRNFQRVRKGEILATNRFGPIRSPDDGLILMPLYQEQGADGFFLVREVRRFWLRLSALLRRLRLDRVLPWLPGVSRHPTDEDALLADPRVCRYFLVEVFHLLGYWRAGEENGRFRFRRRRPDFRGLARGRRGTRP